MRRKGKSLIITLPKLINTVEFSHSRLLLAQIMPCTTLHCTHTQLADAFLPVPVALGGTEGGAPPLVEDGAVTVVDRNPVDCCCCVDETLGVEGTPALVSQGFRGVAIVYYRMYFDRLKSNRRSHRFSLPQSTN